MKTTTEMPSEGQFVAVWQWNGSPWASTYRMIDGSPQLYNEFTDEWKDEIGAFGSATPITYITEAGE